MSDNFISATIEEACEIHDSRRKPIKKGDRIEGKYPYYGASGIADYIRDYEFDGTYLLLSEDGDNLKTQKTPVAFLAKGKFWVNNHAHVLKAKEGNLTEYICYALQVADIKSYISGSTRPKITQSDMRMIPFNLPPLSCQKAIAHILGTLDDKIELNRQMNQTLEAMAQALFKSWFVDFDPVIDNALAAGNEIPEALQKKAQLRRNFVEQAATNSPPEGGVSAGRGGRLLDTNPQLSQLFPSSFEYSEDLGKWIPEGWEVKKLGEDIKVKHGHAFKGEFFSKEPTNDLLLTPGNFKIGGGFKSDKFKYYNGEVPEDYVLNEGDLIITMTDLSKEGDTLGYPAFIPRLSGKRYLHNQRLGRVEFTSETVEKEYMYYQLCLPDYRSLIVGGASGTTVKHTSPSKICSIDYLKAPHLIQAQFSETIKTLISKKNTLDIQKETLAQLRDTLLPQLISGKVRLPAEVIAKAGVPEEVIEKVGVPEEVVEKAEGAVSMLSGDQLE